MPRFGEWVEVRHAGAAADEDGDPTAPERYVAELVLDRPAAMNAVSTEMARGIADACDALRADPRARAVVLSSTHERAFCVGADLKERNRLTDAELADLVELRGGTR